MLCSLKFGIIAVAAVAIVFGVLQFRPTNSDYVFDHEDIEEIALKVLKSGKGRATEPTTSEKLELIEGKLREKYGAHILPKEDLKWMFINCGGWMGSMYLLHASLYEYVLFFATGIDTSGHSGRYFMNISDIVIHGIMRQWEIGGVEDVREYHKGDTILRKADEVTVIQWTSRTVTVEYGRGLAPSSLIFALADTFFSITDYCLLCDMLWLNAKAIGKQLIHFIIFL